MDLQLEVCLGLSVCFAVPCEYSVCLKVTLVTKQKDIVRHTLFYHPLPV